MVTYVCIAMSYVPFKAESLSSCFLDSDTLPSIPVLVQVWTEVRRQWGGASIWSMLDECCVNLQFAGADPARSHICIVYHHKHIKPRKPNQTLIFIAMPL